MTLFPGSFLETLFLIIHNRPYTDNRLIHYNSQSLGESFFHPQRENLTGERHKTRLSFILKLKVYHPNLPNKPTNQSTYYGPNPFYNRFRKPLSRSRCTSGAYHCFHDYCQHAGKLEGSVCPARTRWLAWVYPDRSCISHLPIRSRQCNELCHEKTSGNSQKRILQESWKKNAAHICDRLVAECFSVLR